MHEHRRHTRLPLVMDVEVRTVSGTLFRGKTRNISFGGMLLELEETDRIGKGEAVHLSLILQDDHPEEGGRLAIEFESRVVHKSKGLGIQFIAMDFTFYQHFKNLMVLNSPDPDLLLEELRANPGLLVKGYGG